jgi:Ca-activated chloride channel family protein
MKFALFTLTSLLLVIPGSARAESCFSQDEIKLLVVRASSTTPVKLDEKLEQELVKLATKHQETLAAAIKEKAKQDTIDKLRKLNTQNGLRLCQIVKSVGWPTSALVGRDGVLAIFHLLRNCASFETQRDLLRVIIATIGKDPAQKSDFANLYDRLSVSAGIKQRYGTQALSRNGFLILYPVVDERHLDQRRQQMGLIPLTDQIKELERTYHQPLVRARQSPDSEISPQLKSFPSGALDVASLDSGTISEDDVIRVNTNLVSLNVSVFNDKAKSFVGSLAKEDFKVFEDGHVQTLTYFAATSVPFDLVLLIDLSSSTSKKRDLIIKSTRQFVASARPDDRVAIVTFADEPTVVSPLTLDRKVLAESISTITGGGGSSIWDAIKFTLDTVVGPRSGDRRSAVVLMSDGVDGALFTGSQNFGSTTTFADLIRRIGQSDTLIVPIYLDTESENTSADWERGRYAAARKMLMAMADESGGQYYHARKLTDLDGVYQQVINDLGQVYSLGYKPTNEQRDGSWRNIEIEVVNRPDLKAHSRPGYYAQ